MKVGAHLQRAAQQYERSTSKNYLIHLKNWNYRDFLLLIEGGYNLIATLPVRA